MWAHHQIVGQGKKQGFCWIRWPFYELWQRSVWHRIWQQEAVQRNCGYDVPLHSYVVKQSGGVGGSSPSHVLHGGWEGVSYFLQRNGFSYLEIMTNPHTNPPPCPPNHEQRYVGLPAVSNHQTTNGRT